MMEDRPFLTSLDGSSKRNTPESSLSPVYPRNSTQERHNVFRCYQDENLITIKVEVKEEPEDPSVMDGEPCQEEAMPPEISTDTRDTQGDIKPEDEEEGHVRIKQEAEETYVVGHPCTEEEIVPDISTDGSSNSNTPERSPSPPYSQDSTQERHNVFHCYQDENLITIKVEVKEEAEDSSVMDGVPCQEETMPEISTDPQDTRDTQGDIKPEDEEEGHVRIQEEAEETYVVDNPCMEEEIPPGISTAVKRKPKEYSRELRDKVIELHNSGRGYKMISKCLHVPVYSVRSIIKKWKVHQTTETLPRKGRPSKLSEQTRIRLVREATERPSVTLDELQKTMIEAGIRVHKTTISRALNRTGLLLSKKHGFMNAVDDNG